jgi:hypothetical protein
MCREEYKTVGRLEMLFRHRMSTTPQAQNSFTLQQGGEKRLLQKHVLPMI